MKALIARTDRLGDVVLSLPVFSDLKARHPGWELHALVAPEASPLVENDPGVARVWTARERELPALAAELAAARFDAAVLLHYRQRLAAALRRAGVPRLIGPLSKWSSWLLLNEGVRQGRSRVQRHERDYNVLLARRLEGRGPPPDAGPPPDPRLRLTAAQIEAGRRFRAEGAPGARALVYVHPGSGGSALNWPPERFGAVAARLAAVPGVRVLLTGGAADAAIVARAQAAAGPAVASVAGRFDLRSFLSLLAAGDLLIGPSTGPLHMAAALGLAVVGVYPPLPAQSAARWGPLGPRAQTVAATAACPARLSCRRERCRFWNCMLEIEVDAVVAAARRALQLATGGGS